MGAHGAIAGAAGLAGRPSATASAAGLIAGAFARMRFSPEYLWSLAGIATAVLITPGAWR